MRIIIDESLSPSWATLLIQADLLAIHWSALGPGNASDVEIMAYAVEHRHIILTHDLDFGINLSSFHSKAPSVIQLRSFDTSAAVVGEHVIQAIRANWSALVEGALLTVDIRGIPRTRLTILPIA